MVAPTDSFEAWLTQAQLPQYRLTPEQLVLLQAAFCFRHHQGCDYYANRLLGHFLLHCGSGLKVATIARLLGISRPTASKQQSLSAKQAIQQAHHRMDGRPYGKLLPRYAGPLAHFLCTHSDATRADLIDFVSDTFGVRVSRIALYKFLKKYGLDRVPHTTPTPPLPLSQPVAVRRIDPAAAASPPPFYSGGRRMPVPS